MNDRFMRALFILCFLITRFAGASEGLSVELVSSTTAVVPGEAFQVGLHIQHEEGFHTYWKNPGIVGLATSISWTLPDGFRVSEISWPYPERTFMGSHPCYGYERDVTLVATVFPPAEISENEITLEALATWMCCSDTCHPGSARLIQKLDVKRNGISRPEGCCSHQECARGCSASNGSLEDDPYHGARRDAH